MEGLLARKLLDIRRNLDDRENLIYTLTQGIAPVIDRMKPGAVLNFSRNNRNIFREWVEYRDYFAGEFDVKYHSLLEEPEREVIFFYDESTLGKIFIEPKSREFLNIYGYMDCNSIYNYINTLKTRLSVSYPHEIGLFLGIPLEDVIGFIENNGKNYIFSGYWKVYNLPNRAINIFREYDRSIERALVKKFIN